MEESLISNLEALVASWKEQFSKKPSLNFVWSLDEDTLYLNGIMLCLIEDLTFKKPYFGTETLRLNLKNGWVDIIIDWPHQGDAYLSKFVYHREIARFFNPREKASTFDK